MLDKLKKLLALKPSDFAILIEIWFKLLLAWASFVFLPKSTATRLWVKQEPIRNKRIDLTTDAAKSAEVDSVVKLLQIAVSHHLVALTCLHRVLVLKNMMDKKGVSASIVIGVRKDKNELAAHAWLQVGGQVVADQKDYTDQFKPLDDQGAASLAFLNGQGNS